MEKVNGIMGLLNVSEAVGNISNILERVALNSISIKQAMGEIRFAMGYYGIPALSDLQAHIKAFHSKRLSRGNAKLAKSIGIWSIPAVDTCPNCDDCKAKCYAMKAQRQYPNVRVFRLVNWILAEYYQWELADMLAEQIRKEKLAVIRIHEAGDFYSHKYTMFWFDFALRHRNVTFYGYTKVQGAYNSLNSIGNVNFVSSVLPTGEVNFGDLEWVKATSKKHSFPVCPVTLGVEKAKCGATCRLCQTKRNVLFVAH